MTCPPEKGYLHSMYMLHICILLSNLTSSITAVQDNLKSGFWMGLSCLKVGSGYDFHFPPPIQRIAGPPSNGLPVEGGVCCLKRKPQLGIGQLGWSLEGVIEPIPEVAVGKQVQAEQSHQAAERQVILGTELKILEQQHGNQCCPNLCLQGVGAGADEGLDLEMLFEHFEEELNFPAVPVYPANGVRSEGKVVGQKLNLPLVLFIPDNHSAQQPRILLFGYRTGEADDLVGEDVSALRQGTVMYDFVDSVALEPGNKEDTGFIPLPEEFKVTVSPVHSDDAASRKCKMVGRGDIGGLAIGDHGEVRQIAIVVKEQMELNGALGLAEISPGKHAETEVDYGGIEAEQLILEAKLFLFTGALAVAEISQMEEGILVKLPWSMGAGVGKRALGGGNAQSQVTKLAACDGQSVADLPQALGLSELTEEHGDILVPGGEALGMAFCPALMDQPQKRHPGNNLENLTEQTCGKLHSRDSFVVFGDSLMVSPYHFEESLFYSTQLENLFWTRMIRNRKTNSTTNPLRCVKGITLKQLHF